MFNKLGKLKVYKLISISLIAMFLVSKTSSEVPYDLRVHQSILSDGLLTSYISLTDNKGDLIKELKQQDITVSYGENLGEIESFNFYDQSEEGIGFIFLVDISKSITKENFFNSPSFCICQLHFSNIRIFQNREHQINSKMLN